MGGGRKTGASGVGRERPSRPRAMALVAMIAAVSGFTLTLTAVTLTEVYGPSTELAGRVVDTDAQLEERRSSYGGKSGDERFVVTGERVDGTLWTLRGEDAYDFARDHSREDLIVRTSSLTGAVTALVADAGAWRLNGSGLFTFAGFLGLSVVALLAAAVGGHRWRPDRSWYTPLGRGRWLVSVGGGLLLGLSGVALLHLYRLAPSPAVDTTDDVLGGVAARPYEVDYRGRDLVVVDPGNLTAEAGRQLELLSGDAVAVMVVEHRSPAHTWREFWLVDGVGADTQSIDCPAQVDLSYPLRTDDTSYTIGFVCFPARATGTTLEERPFFGELPDPEGILQVEIP